MTRSGTTRDDRSHNRLVRATGAAIESKSFFPAMPESFQVLSMDKHNLFTCGLVLLAVIILGYSFWVIATPPVSDDLHAWALSAIGILMLIIGYGISRRDRGL